ncbi:Coenzyme PQQ synthesis protein E [uncultured archaeon]|nr:Coenzyme PQQ synthesis protein E [uncultured archaeon]
MFDTDFYMKVHDVQRRIEKGEIFGKEALLKKFEGYRNKEPAVYNIETTNACNMRCEMCPRTTRMTRPITQMDNGTFRKVIAQIKPHSKEKWAEWVKFVKKNYGIEENEMSENHFFLYIIPNVIQLHGYGDPLLDRNLGDYLKLLSEKGFYSYFSCNPANIDIEKTVEMFKNGLDYIKYSLESVDDAKHKQIRGNASNFSASYEKILKLLEIKKEQGLKTTIIITMIDLNRPSQKEDFELLKKAFEGKDVYIYLKSEDQQWYRKDFHGTKSVHWSEICKHPWMSMTIKSDGMAAMCMEDYNNEIILGDVKKETLRDIWNGKKYAEFRRSHFDLTPGLKCTVACDMKLAGNYVK